jgi:oligopeptidase A
MRVQLAKRLFGVDIEAADGQVPVWDKSVRFFVVKQEGQPKAHFYLDPYSRPEEKRGGAWMDEVTGQSRLVRPARMQCVPHGRWAADGAHAC